MKTDADFTIDEHRAMAENGLNALDTVIACLSEGTATPAFDSAEDQLPALQALVGVLDQALGLVTGRGNPEPYPGANEHVVEAAFKTVAIARLTGLIPAREEKANG